MRLIDAEKLKKYYAKYWDKKDAPNEIIFLKNLLDLIIDMQPTVDVDELPYEDEDNY